MKRIPINYHEFLRNVVARAPLGWEEQALLERVLRDGGPRELEQAARTLIDSLIDRGVLTVLERVREGDSERLRLRDSERKLRIHIRLPLRPYAPEAKILSLPLDLSARTGIRYHQVQGLLAIQGSLVTYDRVMTPRELVQRMERAARELIPVAWAGFHPFETPAGEDWGKIPSWNGFPIRPEELGALSSQRDHLVFYPDLGKDGSLLFIGLGDEETGWRGLLALSQPEREHFTPEKIALSHLVAQHFQCMISTSLRLKGLIFYDFLTGIYNRSYFEEQLDRELALAERRDQSLALLIIDVDDFKSFNTRYGYEGGNRVLATVACVLKAALRNTDTLARYGGEEFAVILAPPVPRDEARAICERLRAAVAGEPLALRGLDGQAANDRVTVSIGGALYPESGRGARDLWNGANRLLLEAKSRGKNAVRFAGDAS